MADTTVNLDLNEEDPKVTIDYHIDANTDIAVSDDTEGNKEITFTKKF